MLHLSSAIADDTARLFALPVDRQRLRLCRFLVSILPGYVNDHEILAVRNFLETAPFLNPAIRASIFSALPQRFRSPLIDHLDVRVVRELLAKPSIRSEERRVGKEWRCREETHAQTKTRTKQMKAR